jgi:hypothetical protein
MTLILLTQVAMADEIVLTRDSPTMLEVTRSEDTWLVPLNDSELDLKNFVVTTAKDSWQLDELVAETRGQVTREGAVALRLGADGQGGLWAGFVEMVDCPVFEWVCIDFIWKICVREFIGYTWEESSVDCPPEPPRPPGY